MISKEEKEAAVPAFKCVIEATISTTKRTASELAEKGLSHHQISKHLTDLLLLVGSCMEPEWGKVWLKCVTEVIDFHMKQIISDMGRN